MAQYVRRYALLDPNRFGSITHDPVELACGDGQEGIAAGKQPQPWLRHPPVVLEDRQQLWREHRMPVLLAFPCSTRISMRLLSMSDTLRLATSETRRPAP